MDKSIFDPHIPYIGPIYGARFSSGEMVRIQGLAPGIGYRFNINLQCGQEIAPRDDVAVQISVRLLDGYISLNSLQHGIWGEEQRGALPLKRNEKFEIIVMCDFNKYKVAINGEHYCEFPQRVHQDRITHLAIDGDVSIFRISYESAGSDAGVASGSGIPQASAPIPTPPGNEERNDFEMIDATTNRPPQPGIHNPPSPDFSQPPSYEVASRAPYPTTGPVGMPYPTSGSVKAPYPTSSPVGMPYPTNVPTGVSPYPPAGASRAPPPPVGAPTAFNTPLSNFGAVGAPTPLNAPSSYFRPVKPTSTKKCCVSVGAVILGIIIIIAVVVARISVSNLRHNSRTDHSSSHDSNYYGNSYDHYGSNNNGGYNSHNNQW